MKSAKARFWHGFNTVLYDRQFCRQHSMSSVNESCDKSKSYARSSFLSQTENNPSLVKGVPQVAHLSQGKPAFAR